MRNAKSPFNAMGYRCVCEGLPEGDCRCMDEERVLRNIAGLNGALMMTPEQRAWCIDQIKWVGDNTNQPTDDELADMSSPELARATLGAWSDYVSSVS